jgi:hypothetical protein
LGGLFFSVNKPPRVERSRAAHSVEQLPHPYN